MESQSVAVALGLPPRRRPSTAWGLALLSLIVGGCAGGQQSSPPPLLIASLAAYRAALASDDPAAAYRLLQPALRQRLSIDDFRTTWQQSRVERQLQLRQLDSGDGSTSSTAIVALPHGIELALRQQPSPLDSSPTNQSPARNSSGRRPTQPPWLVTEPDLAAVHAESPEQLLELLATAVERRNYFAALRLLSRGERQAIELELRERVERLRSSLARRQALPIEVHGNRARYQYDPRFFIDLVREEAGWRVLDLN